MPSTLREPKPRPAFAATTRPPLADPAIAPAATTPNPTASLPGSHRDELRGGDRVLDRLEAAANLVAARHAVLHRP